MTGRNGEHSNASVPRNAAGVDERVPRPRGQSANHVAMPHDTWYSHVVMSHEDKLDLLQGTLDLMVLQTLSTMGPKHGYGIARRIEQSSGDTVLLNQGTIYASLVRLQHRRLISAKWGTSDNNRRARFYTITTRGQKRLEDGTADWARLSAVMTRILEP